MVKVDLITGFLGSGKTTFIKEYAKHILEKGEKICILENDYGAINVDMVMLQDLFGDNCNLEMIVGGDGNEAHKRRFRTKLISMGMLGYNRVIIEPSGIYDMDEFFDILHDEPLDRWYEIGNVITVLDSNTEKDLDDKSQYILMSECAYAGKIVLSKLDDKDADECREKSTLYLNETMEKFGCSTRFDKDKDVISKPFPDISDSEFDEISACGFRHASYEKLPIGEKQYNSLFYFGVKMSRELLEEKIKALFSMDNVGNIIRVKGFVRLPDDSQLEVNVTRKQTTMLPIVSTTDVLIIIGENLDKSVINDLFRDYCTQVSL